MVKAFLLSIGAVLIIAIIGIIIGFVGGWLHFDAVAVGLIAAWVAIFNVVLAQVVAALLANDKAQTDSLQAYLKEMGEVLAKIAEDESTSLRDASGNLSEVGILAQAHTRTVLRGLDSARKRIVLGYLDDTRLTSTLLDEAEVASLRKETGAEANGERDTVVTSERANQAPQSEPAPNMQGKPGPNGTAIDAIFVHRATSENTLENWTRVDHQLINDNPNAILFVTQNWNPGGGWSGTYNDHPIGVWYHPYLQKWTIFNQDQEALPPGAAFNVAALKDPLA